MNTGPDGVGKGRVHFGGLCGEFTRLQRHNLKDEFEVQLQPVGRAANKKVYPYVTVINLPQVNVHTSLSKSSLSCFHTVGL